MPYADLREYMAVLEQRGKLRRVAAEVDRDWELSCVARWVFQALPDRERYALLFERVKGSKIPVVLGVVGGSQEIYALAMETTPDKIYERWIQAYARPIEPKEVGDGPVKEVVKKGDEVDLGEIPVPIWTPGKDGGPFITAPFCISRDPDTGIHNVGTYRVQVLSRNTTGILISPHQDIGRHFFYKYEPRGQSMPIAIALGTDPSIGLVSVTKMPYGVDEYTVAGGIRGKAIETVRGETVDLQVPATAEYVLEGEVVAGERADEGPFGEWTGHMGVKGKRPVIRINCITQRRDPIYQAFLSQMPPSESSMIRGIGYSCSMYRQLVVDIKEQGVLDVHLLQSSGSSQHVIIQMRPQYPGHAKKIMMIASHLLDGTKGKVLVVVDEDIDIRDDAQVNWAIGLRTDPARDVIIIDNTAGAGLDPSARYERGTDSIHVKANRWFNSKMLIDATIKNRFPAIALPPKRHMYAALERWKEYGLPEIQVPERTRLLLEKHPEDNVYIDPYAPY